MELELEPFSKVTSIITPFNKANVDTDQIIPKQFLKLITKSGFGKFLFYDWRFDHDGKPKNDFVLNNSLYKNSQILVTNENFGCGSSREHAVWALKDFGFNVIISPSFADIFYSNCFKNGVLPIILDIEKIHKLLQFEDEVELDLNSQKITLGDESINFEIDSYRKIRLLKGLDDIDLTLKEDEKIATRYYTIKELSLENQSISSVKVGGLVKPNSINISESNRLEVWFYVYQGEDSLQVYYNGTRPDLFKDDAEVVVAGKFDNNLIMATELQTKCASRYEGDLKNTNTI